MRMIEAKIKRYGSLKDVGFEGKPLLVFVGPNGQGKSLIFEALYRFFTDFSSIGGKASPPISDILWYRRESDNPIEIEVVLDLDESEVSRFIPLSKTLFALIKEKFKEAVRKVSIRRSLSIDGSWKTLEIKWADIPLVTEDSLITPQDFFDVLSPVPQLRDYEMYFFTEGFSKDNIGGDRILVHLKKKKGFTSHAHIDELVKKGVIESSIEHVGKKWQDWAKEKGYGVVSPTAADLAELPIVTSEMLQKVVTALATLKGVFKLHPAARDAKSSPAQRGSLLESILLQTITSTSIDRHREAEKKWERYRSYVEPLLSKRLEPNPTQVLIKEVDLGLLPGQIGGGEQSIMGLIWETMDHGFIYAIEEPENHLHPSLQREIFRYFLSLANANQVLLCTHSAVFASKPEITAVYIVSKNEEGATQVEPISESNINRVIEELGVRASDMLDYDIVAFVEGADDVKIFTALARRIGTGSEFSVGFIDSEGWNSMAYYANARVLKSRRIKVEVYAIFDGDTEKEERNRKIKERLVSTLHLKGDHVITLKRNSIEAYLLIPTAIKRAFPHIRLSMEEISAFISENAQKKNKKEVLRLVLKRGGIDSYNGEIGAQIMQAMTENEIHEELKEIISVLSSKGRKKQKITPTQSTSKQ